MTEQPPDPLDALKTAAREHGLSVSEELLAQVLAFETEAAPDTTAEVRRAGLRRLIEDAVGANQ